MIFNLDPSIGHKSQFEPLRIGIANWKSVWNQRFLNKDECWFDIPVTTLSSEGKMHQYLPQDEPSMWRRPGFWKYASEFWLLAQAYLDRMEFSAIPAGVVGNHHDTTSMARLNHFVKKFSDSKKSQG